MKTLEKDIKNLMLRILQQGEASDEQRKQIIEFFKINPFDGKFNIPISHWAKD